MSYLSLALFSLSSILLLFVWRQKRKHDSNKDSSSMKLKVPKGPMSLPIVGNIIQLGDRPYETMFKWRDKYGPVYKLKLGSQEVVVLNGTDIIREAFINYGEEFAGRPQLYMIHATLKGKGMISSPYNQDFNEHKKFLINTFNRFGRRRSSLEVNCLQTISETLNDYREQIDHNFEYTHNQIKNSLSQITSQNVFKMTFGISMDDTKYFSTLVDLVTENFNNTSVAAAFNFIPISRIFKKFILKNVLRCSEFLNNLISEKMKQYHEEIDHIDFDEDDNNAEITIIECYLKELMTNANFLSNFPMENMDDSSISRLFNVQSRKLTEKRRSSLTNGLSNERFRSSYKSFSFDHLSSIVQDLFIAGTETTSLTINWAIIYVIYFPECQKRICEDIDKIIGRERLPTESDRYKLIYVEAFILETLRHHCAGPILIPRSLTKDTVFRDYQLPENTFILANMWSCMRDPAYWNEPDKFDPSRFIDADGNLKCKNPAMMPFSVGKRACIGESIARLQIFLIFTSLLQKFSFSFANEKDYKNKKLLLGHPGIGLNPPKVSLKLKLR